MSITTSKRSVLITGCTAGGIGHALAREFHSRGLHVIATARTKEAITDLEALGMSTLSLEVNNEESIQAAAKEVARITGGKLYILVNNAGVNCTVPALDVDIDAARFTFETNFFAVVRITQVFIPLLIEAKGLIINIGSVAAIVPYVFGSIYNASKAALHAYSRCLRLELAPFSVKVMVVVTGGVSSNIARTDRTLPPNSLYLDINEDYQRRVKHSQAGAMSNEVYAKGVVDGALARNGPKRTIWRGNKSWLIWFVRNWVGSWMFDRILPGMFGLVRLGKLWREKGGKAL